MKHISVLAHTPDLVPQIKASEKALPHSRHISKVETLLGINGPFGKMAGIKAALQPLLPGSILFASFTS